MYIVNPLSSVLTSVGITVLQKKINKNFCLLNSHTPIFFIPDGSQFMIQDHLKEALLSFRHQYNKFYNSLFWMLGFSINNKILHYGIYIAPYNSSSFILRVALYSCKEEPLQVEIYNKTARIKKCIHTQLSHDFELPLNHTEKYKIIISLPEHNQLVQFSIILKNIIY